MNRNLTQGSIGKGIFMFALPLMFGNLMQQLYNITDTFIVGRFIGANALAAVGSSYALIIFLTSVILGLCMGSGVFFSIQFGKGDSERLKKGIFSSFILIGIFCLIINILVYVFIDQIIFVLQIPEEIRAMTKEYLLITFLGIFATFLYNYFANMLRAIGNSLLPVLFLALVVVINIFLDVVFVVYWDMGVAGAAAATVIAQYISSIGVIFYSLKFPELRLGKSDMEWDGGIVKSIANLSLMTSLQQSIMNFGILTVQGLVNSFGTVVMAGFSTAVKIDTLAYSPVQDFGNAFSTFVAQNYGAGDKDRIKKGTRISLVGILIFCALVGSLVFIYADRLMGIFVDESVDNVIKVGVEYLRIVSIFYFGIGILFMFYGYFRSINQPQVSVILTVVSLGTRVALAFGLSALAIIGVKGIWLAIPIGWILADLCGLFFYNRFIKMDDL